MKLETFKSWNWSAIVAALFALGIVTTNEPQMAAISVAGMLIVALLNFLARTFGVRVGAGWLTVGLYAVSTILAYILNPIPLPAIPAYPGDPVTFAQAVAELIAKTAPIATLLMASSTLVYNALKPLVFDKYLPAVEPDEAHSEQAE